MKAQEKNNREGFFLWLKNEASFDLHRVSIWMPRLQWLRLISHFFLLPGGFSECPLEESATTSWFCVLPLPGRLCHPCFCLLRRREFLWVLAHLRLAFSRSTLLHFTHLRTNAEHFGPPRLALIFHAPVLFSAVPESNTSQSASELRSAHLPQDSAFLSYTVLPVCRHGLEDVWLNLEPLTLASAEILIWTLAH